MIDVSGTNLYASLGGDIAIVIQVCASAHSGTLDFTSIEGNSVRFLPVGATDVQALSDSIASSLPTEFTVESDATSISVFTYDRSS